jgi:hypothetical protein
MNIKSIEDIKTLISKYGPDSQIITDFGEIIELCNLAFCYDGQEITVKII